MTVGLGPGEPAAVDAMPQQHEQSGHHEEGADGGDDDDAHAGIGERAEEVLREDEKGGERDRDRARREHDRTSGGVHRRPDRVGHARPEGELFPEAADHQQRVVDAESEPEGSGQVDREDRHVGDAAEESEFREGPGDRHRADGERQQGRDHSPEHDEQEQERHGNGDDLREKEVLQYLLGQFGAHRGTATGLDGESSY